jgi:hypothetical protein
MDAFDLIASLGINPALGPDCTGEKYIKSDIYYLNQVPWEWKQCIIASCSSC